MKKTSILFTITVMLIGCAGNINKDTSNVNVSKKENIDSLIKYHKSKGDMILKDFWWGMTKTQYDTIEQFSISKGELSEDKTDLVCEISDSIRASLIPEFDANGLLKKITLLILDPDKLYIVGPKYMGVYPKRHFEKVGDDMMPTGTRIYPRSYDIVQASDYSSKRKKIIELYREKYSTMMKTVGKNDIDYVIEVDNKIIQIGSIGQFEKIVSKKNYDEYWLDQEKYGAIYILGTQTLIPKYYLSKIYYSLKVILYEKEYYKLETEKSTQPIKKDSLKN